MARSGAHGFDGGDAAAASPPGAKLVSRAQTRARSRAASALAAAGEIEDAAHLFEAIGDSEQAAGLRLEHARTLRDDRRRLMALREGASRNLGDSAQVHSLHRALAKALLSHAEALEDGALRRGLRLEAAEALEQADVGTEAGEIYEDLGLLPRAARAYEAGGAITQLEVVLALLDHHESALRCADQLEADVESAWRLGQRRRAHALLDEHIHAHAQTQRRPRTSVTQTMDRLLSLLPRRRRLRIASLTSDMEIRVHGGEYLRIGRAPDAEFTVEGAAISREHADLRVEFTDSGTPVLMVRDRGSRAGTFWNGDPIEPGETVEIGAGGELGLGIALSFEIVAAGSPEQPVAFLRPLGRQGGSDSSPSWTLFAPLGCRLSFAPGAQLPFTITFDDPYIRLTSGAQQALWLDEDPLGLGAPVELLVHDRIRCPDPALHLEVRDFDGVPP